MPTLAIKGSEIYYEAHGTSPETIVFAHDLLWSGAMFAPRLLHSKIATAVSRLTSVDRGVARLRVLAMIWIP